MTTETENTAAELKWKEPPASAGGNGSSKWAGIAEQLRANPGRWALVAEGSSAAVAANIKRGSCRGMTKGQFEATARSDGKGRFDTYARYVGVPS